MEPWWASALSVLCERRPRRLEAWALKQLNLLVHQARSINNNKLVKKNMHSSLQRICDTVLYMKHREHRVLNLAPLRVSAFLCSARATSASSRSLGSKKWCTRMCHMSQCMKIQTHEAYIRHNFHRACKYREHM